MEKFTKYTTSWERPASLEEKTSFTSPWTGEHEPPSHSVPPAIAGKIAETYGPEIFHRFHQLLLEAYFTHNRTVSDVDVLADIAEQAGIDANEFRQKLEEGHESLFEAVANDHNEAMESGVSGVPAVIVDDKYLVGGAVDVDHYRRVIEHSQAEKAKEQ